MTQARRRTDLDVDPAIAAATCALLNESRLVMVVSSDDFEVLHANALSGGHFDVEPDDLVG